MNFIITIAVATIVGLVFYKLKVPGGLMIGAIVGVAILNITTSHGHMPYEAKMLAQMISGAFIGSGISRSDLKNFKNLFKPILILCGGMLVLNIILGFIIYYVTTLDFLTSFFVCVPGGMSDMPIIAAEMGADGAIVALLQFVRLCAGLALFPALIQFYGRKQEQEQVSMDTTQNKVNKTEFHLVGMLTVLMTAFVGGLVGKTSGIPSGILLFALIFTIIGKQLYEPCMLPVIIRRVAQILAGAYIGTSIQREDVGKMPEILLPAILLVIGYFVACIFISKGLQKYCDFKVKDSMLCATPAGASDMALISADLGVNNPNISVLQIARMLSAIIIFPQIIYGIYTLLS